METRCALDAKLVMLVCETEPAPGFPSCSSGVFFARHRGLRGTGLSGFGYLQRLVGWGAGVRAAINISSFRQFSSPKVFSRWCHGLPHTPSPLLSPWGECCSAAFHLLFYHVLRPQGEVLPAGGRRSVQEEAPLFFPSRIKNLIVQGF